MTLQNYRVTFGGLKIDYKSNFAKCRRYMRHVHVIMHTLSTYGVPENKRWWFFEPYVEITWIEDNEEDGRAQMSAVKRYIESQPDIEGANYLTPENGEFADWYFAPGNLLERQFGYERYALCARQAELFYRYMNIIDVPEHTSIDGNDCKGLEEHYTRSCHVLANQLGLSYKDEGRLLFWRGILCKLFWWFGHKKAVWIYTKIFRQKY